MSKIGPLYVVYGTSESGDFYVAGIYDAPPTDDQLSAIIRKEFPQEIEDGTSYLRLQYETVDSVEALPEPDPEPVDYL